MSPLFQLEIQNLHEETQGDGSFQWQHAILCTLSLKIPLYRATRFAGISPFPGVSLLHSLVNTLFCFPCSSLFSSSLSLSTSFTITFLANFTLFLFFFLFLFFSSVKTKTKLVLNTPNHKIHLTHFLFWIF